MSTASRRWYIVAVAGFALAMLAMLLIVLTMLSKEHFGWMVGPWFLPIVSVLIIVGGLLLLVAVLALPQRKTALGISLIVWALIALTSPLFGFLILAPWSVLLLLTPVVVTALVKWRAA